MGFFGEIADAILIGAACVVGDVECAVSTIGVNKTRAVGNSNNGGYKPVTDKKPSNPPEPPKHSSNATTTTPHSPPEAQHNDDTNNNGGANKQKEKNKHSNSSKNKHSDVNMDSNKSDPTRTDNVVVDDGETSIDATMKNRPVYNPYAESKNGGIFGSLIGNRNPTGKVIIDAEGNMFNGQNVGADINRASAQMYTGQQPIMTRPFANQQILHNQPTQVSNIHKVDQPRPAPKFVVAEKDVHPVASDPASDQVLKDMIDVKDKKPSIPFDETSIASNARDAANNIDTTTVGCNKFPDNELMIQTNPFLGQIQNIAIENGYQIKFESAGFNGELIVCSIYDNSLNKIDGKGFVIDTGSIIDRRKKIFLGFPNTFERQNAYHLFANSTKGNIRPINADFIRGIIVGGNSNVTAKPMYTQEFVDLNGHVAMITMPNVNKDDRKYIQDALIKTNAAGVFNEIRYHDMYARFRIAKFDKASKSILLDSLNVPMHYGHQYVVHPRHQILIENNQVTAIHSNFIECD